MLRGARSRNSGRETLSRVRTPGAVMLHVVVLGGYYDIISDDLAEIFRISIAVTFCCTLLYGEQDIFTNLPGPMFFHTTWQIC